MLDTHARRFVDPLIEAFAANLKRVGFSANAVTALAMLIGVGAAGAVGVGHNVWGVALLWVSGLLDASDGALARMTKSTPVGAILDITSDRVVEISTIVALAWRFSEARLVLVVLAGTIAIAMSLFLSIAAALRNSTVKAFHYAPGLGERTEAFICLSLMMLDPGHLVFWTWIFEAVLVFTMYQRLRYAMQAIATES